MYFIATNHNKFWWSDPILDKTETHYDGWCYNVPQIVTTMVRQDVHVFIALFTIVTVTVIYSNLSVKYCKIHGAFLIYRILTDTNAFARFDVPKWRPRLEWLCKIIFDSCDLRWSTEAKMVYVCKTSYNLKKNLIVPIFLNQ